MKNYLQKINDLNELLNDEFYYLTEVKGGKAYAFYLFDKTDNFISINISCDKEEEYSTFVLVKDLDTYELHRLSGYNISRIILEDLNNVIKRFNNILKGGK